MDALIKPAVDRIHDEIQDRIGSAVCADGEHNYGTTVAPAQRESTGRLAGLTVDLKHAAQEREARRDVDVRRRCRILSAHRFRPRRYRPHPLLVRLIRESYFLASAIKRSAF